MITLRKVERSFCVAVLVAVAAIGAIGMVGAACARAAGDSAVWWNVNVGSRPTALQVGGHAQLFVAVENLGDAGSSGDATLTATVPAGYRVLNVEGRAGGTGNFVLPSMSCSWQESPVSKETSVSCLFGEYKNASKEVEHDSLPPYEMLEARIAVSVLSGASAEGVFSGAISGGGAAHTAAASRHLAVGGEERFGIEEYTLIPENFGGGIDAQAGSHPYQLTSVLSLDQQPLDSEGEPLSVGLAHDMVGELPVGMFGNPTPFAQCTDAQFSIGVAAAGYSVNECPAASAVGVAVVQDFKPGVGGFETSTVPIFNMTPLPGEPARFAFKVQGFIAVYLDTAVQSGGDYSVSVGSHDITEIASLLDVRLTFWGVPGSTLHDGQRGWECLNGYGTCAPSTNTQPPPFLVMPTSCGQPFQSRLTGDSWPSAGHPEEKVESLYTLPEPVDGCNHLSFEPQVGAVPDAPDASTSTGFTVKVTVPQEAALNPDGLAESTLKETTVALPAGVAVNPSGGDGLEGCSEGLVGFTGVEEGGDERDLFTPRLPGSDAAVEAGELAPLQPGVNFCSNQSKIATAVIHTPLLTHAIEGAVYIASQNANPFGSLIALYLVAEDPVSGTLVKLPGEVDLCQTVGETIAGMTCGAPGQLITTFKNTPELPFEELELHFFGGERAPLATPAHCGTYTTDATFVPWSGNEAVHSQGTFQITSGPDGSPCPGASLPFSPLLTGGAIDNNGGAFSPLSTTIGRQDGEQNMQSVTLHMPPGLSGTLSSVKLCAEAQANEGTCGAESLIGETTVSAGVGSDPVSVKGGRVYITEKYDGAPFGLSIVNPVKAGPFDLEHDTSKPATNMPPCDCIVVRAKIEVDPQTAALTITTDSSGPHAIPHLIDGIPVQIKKVNVLINRPGFTFNPTNCTQMQITGAIGSNEGASSPVSVPFDVANCAKLAFEPDFSVSTQAKTSKRYGAGLHVVMAYPDGAAGKDANLKYVKVELPKALPSRLETLKQACLEMTFDTNPASCPAASIVGHAVVHTPVLPVPLTGPAYFVSHGGKEFPSLTMVLQGDGVTVELVGETYISKGVTSSTFNSTPDVPFESFELTLPTGSYSALAANGNLCDQKLVMPTRLLGQNGAQIQKQTRIAIQGCPSGLKVLSKKVKGDTLKLRVVTPSAGTLEASGKGLSSTSESAGGREPLTLVLHIKGSHTKSRIKLAFKPAKGKRLTKTLSLTLRRG